MKFLSDHLIWEAYTGKAYDLDVDKVIELLSRVPALPIKEVITSLAAITPSEYGLFLILLRKLNPNFARILDNEILNNNDTRKIDQRAFDHDVFPFLRSRLAGIERAYKNKLAEIKQVYDLIEV